MIYGNMSEQTLIKEYPGIISEVQSEIKKLENDIRVLNKLYVILDILHDNSISEITEKHDISQGTVYNWARQFNNGGVDGLSRKSGSKGQSKLTDEEFEQSDLIIQDNDLKTAKEVHHVILSLFHVNYSIRQVERIMKNLGYTYTKPYKIYHKMPENAKDELKKRRPHRSI